MPTSNKRQDRRLVSRNSRRKLQNQIPTHYQTQTLNYYGNDNPPPTGGLDLSLFPESVSPDLLCALCGRVLAQPQVTKCKHIFCGICLQNHAFQGCPHCGARLEATSNTPPAELSRRMLELQIRCDHKCGQVLPLGYLPTHVSVECPNTPVPCTYARKGCKMTVRRCELEEHGRECEFRWIECEACDEKILFKDLVAHQKRSRCVENRIRNQLINAVRLTRKEVQRYQKTIELEQVKVEHEHRRKEMEHAKRLNTTRLRSRRNLQQNHPVHFSQHSGEQTGQPNYGPLHADHAGIFRRESCESRQTNIPSRGSGGFTPLPARANTQTKFTNSTPVNSSAFLTSIEPEEAFGDESARISRISRRDSDSDIFNCRNCKRRVQGKRNKPNSCRWHAGPIVEVFGGTCFSCGRLDYQIGCMMGYHEL